jgi:hypothetical protein
MDRAGRAVALLLLGACLLAGPGCEEQLAGELVTLSADYLGDVVSATVASCLESALGIDAATAEEDHAHDAGALHDHEH